MPSRDPSSDESSREPRWGNERPREAGREAERRYRPTAFSEREHGEQDDARTTPGSAFAASRQMRAAGPAGPGSSYGGHAGRASGSQPHEDEPVLRDRPDPATDEAGRTPQLERRRAVGAWERSSTERGRMPMEAGRALGPEDSLDRRPAAHSAERADDTQFDADYRQWRDEQMRLLDLDYAQWRKERYRKFAEEFSQWRSQRLKAQASSRTPPEPEPRSLEDISPLGTPPVPAPRAEDRLRPQEPERERSGGGLLGSLLGGHSERHKAQP